MNTKELIEFYLENNILISPELLNNLGEIDIPINSDFIVLNEDILNIITSKIPINISDYELALLQKEKYHNSKLYTKFLEYIKQNIKPQGISHKKQDTSTYQTTPTHDSTHNSVYNSTHNFTHISSEKVLEKSSSQKIIDKIISTDTILTKNNITNTNIKTTNKTLTKEDDHTSKVDFITTNSNVENTNIENVTKYKEDIEPKITARQQVEIDEQKIDDFRKNFLEKHHARIVSDYNEKSHKRTVADFVGHLNSRFKELEKILRVRQELQNLTSISRILSKKEKEKVAIIGMVYEKAVSKNGNTILTIEDTTGFIKVVVSKTKEELHNLVQEIQLDEIIGVTGTFDGIIFANNVLIPDVPLTRELKKSPQEGYFVVIADPQVGNKLFLHKEFERFISWLNCEVGNDMQRDIASKVKYLFVVGDLVDGVGIYPDQEYDLNIIDITDQYRAFAEYLKKMPNIPIFVCPGNHDVGRISEPQPKFKDEYSKPVWSLPNVIPVSNPSIINIFSNPENNFDGFDVLLYHGYSFFYYFAHIPYIRQKGGPKRSDLVMKYLLQRRHLAPSHSSNLYIPDPKKDPLVIDKIPDFFFTGHVHRATVNNYRNVTCINASCWVSKSEEQERRGLDPQPARAFIINMQTREVKVMNFLSREDQEKELLAEQKAAEERSGERKSASPVSTELTNTNSDNTNSNNANPNNTNTTNVTNIINATVNTNTNNVTNEDKSEGNILVKSGVNNG